jgi:RNA-dependent RNA polymerase
MTDLLFLPVHKDGGKKEKQKEEQEKAENKKFSPSVRCYFVCIESGWNRDVPYILSGCTIDQARRRFMHIHNAPTVSKYLARLTFLFTLICASEETFFSVSTSPSFTASGMLW